MANSPFGSHCPLSIWADAHVGNVQGLPSSDASLSACHSLWTPPVRFRSHLLRSDRVGFRYVNGVANRVLPACADNFVLGAVPAFRECGLPYGLQSSLCTLRLCRSAFTSFTDATLGTSGWLFLTRRGLPFRVTSQEAPSCAWRTNAWNDFLARVDQRCAQR